MVGGAVVAAVWGAAAAATTAGIIAAAAINLAVGFAAAYLVARNIPSAQQGSVSAADHKQMIKSDKEPQRVIYGARRVSIVLNYAEEQDGLQELNNSTGESREKLFMAGMFCNHPVEWITDPMLDDRPLSEFVDDGSFFTSLYLINGTGEIPQPFLDETTQYEASMHGSNSAWATLRLTHNSKLFSGIPALNCMVYGKKILDVRTDTVIWTTNAALIIYDFYVSYMRVNPERLITDGSFGCFKAATNLCFEDIDGDIRYAISGMIKLNQKPSDILNEMLKSCGGTLVRTGGKIGLLPAAWYGDGNGGVFTISETDVVGAISITPQEAMGDSVNIMQGTYVEPDDNWNDQDFEPVRNEDIIARDGYEIPEDINYSFVTNAAQARRLCYIELNRRTAGGAVELTLSPKGAYCRVGRVVELNLPQVGIERYGDVVPTYRVVSQVENSDLTFTITLQRDEEKIYDDTVGVPYTPPPILETGGNIVPAPLGVKYTGGFRVEAGLALQGRLTWSAGSSSTAKYLVQIMNVDTGEVVQSGETKTYSYDVLALPDGVFDGMVRAVDTRGRVSDVVSETWSVATNIMRDNGAFIVQGNMSDNGDAPGHGDNDPQPFNLLPAIYANPSEAAPPPIAHFGPGYAQVVRYQGFDCYKLANNNPSLDESRFYTATPFNNYNMNPVDRSKVDISFFAWFNNGGDLDVALIYDDTSSENPETWRSRMFSNWDWSDGWHKIVYRMDLSDEVRQHSTSPATLRFTNKSLGDVYIRNININQVGHWPYDDEYTFFTEPLPLLAEGQMVSMSIEYRRKPGVDDATLTWGLQSSDGAGGLAWERKDRIDNISNTEWETATIEGVVVGSEGIDGIKFVMTKNNRPEGSTSDFESVVIVRNIQVIPGGKVTNYQTLLTDNTVYKTSSDKVTGGGYDSNNGEGWGFDSDGKVVLNGGSIMNAATVRGGTFIANHVYEGIQFHYIDHNTDNTNDEIYYHAPNQDIRITAQYSFSNGNTISLTNGGYNALTFPVTSCLERRGEVSGSRFRWGKVRAGAMSIKSSQSVNGFDYLEVRISIVSPTGATDLTSGWVKHERQSIAGKISSTIGIGQLTFDFETDWDSFGGSVDFSGFNLANLECAKFGNASSDAHNGRVKVELRCGSWTDIIQDIPVDWKLIVDNDVFPG